MQSERLTGQFLGGQGARVGYGAGGGSDRRALLLPRLEVLDFAARLRVLDPLNDLRHRDEVDVAMLGQDLVHPEEEGVHEFGVVLEPSGVEEKAERRPVLGVMAVKVVVEEGVELLARQDVGARINHGAAGQVFVEGRVFTAIQLVHDDLPDGVAACRALLQVAVATVGHAEVERVRPQGRVLQRRRDGRIVQERLLFHHGELVVAADTQVRGAHTDDRIVGDVGELVDDQTSAGHLLGPVVHRGRGPERLVIVVSDGMGGDLVTFAVDLLDTGVVGVFVRDEEGGLNVAAVGVFAHAVEHVPVQFDVVVVDGVVERHHDHLGHLFRIEFAWNFRASFGAEAIGQQADGWIASRGSVRIVAQIARVLVRSIGTVWDAVAEEAALDASAVVTGQHAFLAEGLVSGQDGPQFTNLLFDEAILDLFFPVARLLLDVESESSWATDGLQTRRCALNDITAVVALTGLQTEPFASFFGFA